MKGSDEGDLLTTDVCRDAVLVVPGIMGSELVDTATGDTLWGLANLGWYVRAWTSGRSLRALATSPDEPHDRIKATRLLRVPAFAPFLRGIEPYTDLLNGVARVLAHRDAVAEFPYDWRLSVEHNAGELAKAADAHLSRWRAHPRGSADARLVLVAHSMGGLVARYFTAVLGGGSEVRATVTLGTPFYGAVKAAVILNAGRGGAVPLPHRRLRELASTLPGVHDLLPSYRCVDEGTTARALTPADVAAVGGDAELAAAAFARRERLLSARDQDTRALVGVEQPTAQSMRVRDGVVEPRFYTCELAGNELSRVDRLGDSTVYRDAAAPAGLVAHPLPQRHGSIARTPEAVAFVRAVLTERPLGPPLAGLTPLGVEVPDVVTAGTPFEVQVTNLDDPVRIGCWVEDARTMRRVAHPELRRRDGGLVGQITVRAPGVYRVQVKRGGASAVSDLFLATEPPNEADEARGG